ncbi:hypothetical protein BLNAU_19703 [Blattamonas nauphoetae]|uniref:Uncharacterized protein n=1 Tax=Blattamonas nauphoetae TaxID=2049346 RepID=A0ABQ9X1B8_9EUKA|nr:hypothetical protein BLNAU_19703 [Blattamonas nauphoetae]
MLIHTNWRKTLDDINIQVRSFTDDPEPRPSQTSCSSRRRGYVQSDPPESKRHRTPLPGTRTVSFHPTTPHRTAVAFSPSLSPPITPVGHAAHHRLWRKHFLSSTGFDTHMQFPFLNTQPDAYVAGSGSIPLLNFDPISTRESIQKYDIDPNDPINFPLTAYVGLTHLFMTRQNRSLCHTTMVEPYFLALQTADLVCAFDTPAMTIGPTSTGLHRYVGLVGRLITKSKFGFINDLVSEIVQSPTNVSYSEFLKLYIAATQYPEISGILGFMSYEDLGWTSKKDWASFIDLFQKKIGDNHHSMSHTTLESQVTRKTRPGFAVMAQLTKPPEIPLLAEIAPLVTKHTGSFSKAINSSLASYLPTLVRSQREMFVTKFPPPRPISSGFMISSGSFHAILTVFELLSAEFRKLQVNIVRSWKQPIKREDRSSDLISTVSILRDTLWIMDIIGSILSSTVGSVGPQFVNITHNLEKEILKLSLLLHIIHADVGFWSYFRTYMLVDYRNRAKKSNDPNVRCDDEKQDEAFGIDLCHPFRDSPYFQPRKLPISQSASTHYICNTLFLPVFNFYQNARVDDYVQVIPTHPPHWSIYITEVTLCSCVQSFIKIIAGWGLGTEKTVHKNTADAQFSWKQRESIFHSAPHIHMYRLSPYGPWVKQVRDPNISDVTAGISSLPFLVLQKSNCKQAQFMRSQRICPSFHKVNYFGAIQTAYDIRFLIKTCCQKFNMPPQMILCQAQSIRLFVVLSAFCRLMMVVAGFPDPNEWGPYANKRLKLHYQSERKLMQCGDDHKPMMLPWVRATFLSGAVGLKKEKEEDVKCYGVDEECIYEDINWESNVKQTILTTWTFMKVIHGEPTLLPYTRSTPDHRKIGSKSHFNWMSCHAPCNIRFDDLPRTNPNVKDISHFRSPPVPAMPPLKHKSTSTPRRPFRPIRSDRSVGRPANSLQPTPTEVKDQQFPMDTNTPQSSLRLSPANQSQLFSPIQQNLVLIPRTSPSVQSSPLSEEMGLIELETPDADSPFEVYNDGDELPKTSRASNAGSNQGSQRSRSESPGPKRVFIEDQPKDDHQSPSWRDNWKTHHRSTSDGIPLLHEHRLLQGPTQKSSLSTLSNQSDDKLEHRNLSSPEHATENDKFNSESDTLQHDSSCSESGRILSPNSHASPPFLSKLGMRNRSFRLQSGSPKLTGTLFGLGTITTPHSQKRASFSTNQRITRENSAEHTLNETMNRGMGGIFAPAATEMILNTKGRRTLAVNQNLEAPPAPDPGSADWDQERFDSDLEDDMSNDDRSTVLSGSRSQVSASQPGSPNSRPTSAGSGSVESNLNSKFGFGLELLIPQQSNSGKGKEQHFAEKVLCANDDFSTPPCTESCNWCLEHGYQTKEMGPALSKPEDDQTSNVDDEIGGLSEDDYQVEGCLGGTMKYVPSTKHLRCRREKRLLAAWLFAELERLLYLSEAE